MKKILFFILAIIFILGFTIGIKGISVKAENEIMVYIDIKPGACPNYLNINSRGFVQIAVLGTQNFDVATIDPTEIELRRVGINGEEVKPVRWVYEDVATPLYMKEDPCDCHVLGGDGYVDLVFKFDARELIDTLNLTELVGETIPLTLTGELREIEGEEEYDIRGQDCILVIDQHPGTMGNPGSK
ncbi:MAG: hypothetical protein JSV09_03020 [Thermoplasmata archaeon]|nr:MAG: hypothetical protein JSV09_03020 [Thermoplasmata archaeon]